MKKGEREIKRLLALGMILFLVSSPAVLAEVIGETDEEVAAIAEPILDNLLESFSQNNYAQYCRDFDETLKESISEKKFLETDRYFEETLGDYQSREYLGFLAKGKMSLVLWKARYNKSKDDVLIKLVLSKRGDTYFVTGLWFQ